MLGGRRTQAQRQLRDSTSQLITLLQSRLDGLSGSDDPRAAQIAIDCAKELAEIKRQIRALDGDRSAIDPEDL
jgi:predicted secreted Zn-dependent protease